MRSKQFKLLLTSVSINALLYLAVFVLIIAYPELFKNTNSYSYLFTESYDQFKEYFPNYYKLVYLSTRLIKFSLPVLGIVFMYKNEKIKGLFKISDGEVWWKSPSINFVSSLTLVLVFYYFLFYGKFLPQLLLTKLFLSLQLTFALFFILANYSYLKVKIKAFLFEAVLPYNISITRILFFSYLLCLYKGLYLRKAGLFEGLEKASLPGIGWLIDLIPVNSELYTWACYIGVICCVFIILGFKTRFFLLLNTLIVFYVVATPSFFGKLWHEQLVIWIAWIMAFSSSYDVLSIDSFIKRKELTKSSSYGFHLKIIWLHFGIIYFFAGFYKLWLCGFGWALSSSMINQVHLEWFEHYNTIPSIRLDLWPNLLMIGGLSVIIFELFYFIFLFSKKTRWISVVGGLAMHNIIGYLMYISFLHLLQAFYIVFIPWNRIASKFMNRPMDIEKHSFSFKQWSLMIPVVILSINILCGVFRINSYPFSIYPVYAAIVPETFTYFEYEILDKEYSELDVHTLGKTNNFRWESYSRFEPMIIEKFAETEILDTTGIKQQWQRWQNGVPQLSEVDSVRIFAVEIYLNPERQKDTINKYQFIDLY